MDNFRRKLCPVTVKETRLVLKSMTLKSITGFVTSASYDPNTEKCNLPATKISVDVVRCTRTYYTDGSTVDSADETKTLTTTLSTSDVYTSSWSGSNPYVQAYSYGVFEGKYYSDYNNVYTSVSFRPHTYDHNYTYIYKSDANGTSKLVTMQLLHGNIIIPLYTLKITKVSNDLITVLRTLL